MTTQLYDYEFSPFTIDGDRRIVASEATWRIFATINNTAKHLGERTRVAVTVDVFEDWRGPMVASNGIPVSKIDVRPWTFRVRDDEPMVYMRDVRARLFELIAATPSLDWLMLTKRPENLKDMLPTIWQTDAMPPNVWLGTSIENQQAADERIPHLLSVPAAVRGLVMEPREVVDLRPKAPNTYSILEFYNTGNFDITKMRPANDRVLNCFPKINHVIIRGGTEPMHPDHVRSIVRQCEAAGVPVWCESPVDGRVVKQLPENKS